MANPIKKFGYVGKGRKAMLLLKQDILTKILLRRTKVQCADVLSLPPRSGSCPSLSCELQCLTEPWLRGIPIEDFRGKDLSCTGQCMLI